LADESVTVLPEKFRNALDLAVETERRTALEEIPLREIDAIAAQISDWLRTSFEQFLSVESPALMGIKDLGEFKFSAIERFRAEFCTERLRRR
jgi:hypothetical protein